MKLSIIPGSDRPCGRLAVHTRADGNVTVVEADVLCHGGLDPERGATVTIDPGTTGKLMADYRYCEFWCRPWFGSDVRKVPDETYCLIAQQDGEYLVVMPVTGDTYKCVLEGTENGLTAKLFSWCAGINVCRTAAFVYAKGKDVYALMEECTLAASKAVGGFAPVRAKRNYPELFEYLGWCSWDAMEIRVSEADLLRKCTEFKEKHIPVRWAILDDMWADVPDFVDAPYATRDEMFRLMHSSRLHAFEAAPERFPQGLKHCIGKMKEMGFTVGMWHPTTGYWWGIDPNGPIFAEYKDCLVQTPTGQWIPSPDKTKAFRFYDAFHTFLQSCGAEFAKVDNQTMIRRFYKGMAPVGQIARNEHTAIDASVGAHFGGTLINCMGMGTEDQWNRPSSAVSRCSDDFQPENRDWFTKHILQCSFNSLVQGQLYWCDWDMWWSDDGQAEKNSILRAISGGPIYTSDPLERSNADIFRPLCLSDGRILRCDRPAMPTAASLFDDPVTAETAFVLQNITGESGIFAAFDLREDEGSVRGSISPCEIPGLEGGTFALWERFTGEVRILRRDEAWEFTLKNRDDYRLWVVAPYVDGCAVIGMEEKFIAPAGVKCRIGKEAVLKEPGTLLRIVDGKPVRTEAQL